MSILAIQALSPVIALDANSMAAIRMPVTVVLVVASLGVWLGCSLFIQWEAATAARLGEQVADQSGLAYCRFMAQFVFFITAVASLLAVSGI